MYDGFAEFARSMGYTTTSTTLMQYPKCLTIGLPRIDEHGRSATKPENAKQDPQLAGKCEVGAKVCRTERVLTTHQHAPLVLSSYACSDRLVIKFVLRLQVTFASRKAMRCAVRRLCID